MTIRIIIADDHAVLRVGMRSFFEDQVDPLMKVVGEAADGDQAIDLLQKLRPDVLLLDLSMQGLGGLETTLELRRRGNQTPILVLTQYAETVYLRRLLEAGANGYILKSARGEELLTAIRAVVGGGTYIDPSLAGSLLARSLGQETPPSDEEALMRLTTREKQVLKFVVEGYSNKEIAAVLDVAVKTVMAHRANLMEKVGIHNRSKLVQFAIRLGLLPVEKS